MRRRTLLALSATLPFAGCVGGSAGLPETSKPTTTDPTSTTETPTSTTPGDRTYRECSLQTLHYGGFPEPVRDEIDAALAEGEYTAKKILLRETMNVTDGYVLKNGTYYTPTIEQQGDQQVLRLKPDPNPELRESRTLWVVNESRTELVVRIRNDDGQQIVEPTRLSPGDDRPIHTTKKIGVYEVELEHGEKTETFDWNVNWSFGSPKLTVKKNGYDLRQSVAGRPRCNFEYGTTSA